jgi:hypothetical protein
MKAAAYIVGILIAVVALALVLKIAGVGATKGRLEEIEDLKEIEMLKV